MADAGSVVPPGDDEIWKRLAALDTVVQQLQASAQLANSGVAASQVSPQVGAAVNNSYTLTSSYAVLAAFNLTVPTGFTRALISAQGAATAASANPGGADDSYAQVVINGAAGGEGRAIQGSGNAPQVSAFASSILTGLTAGQLIPVNIQARLAFGPGVSPAVIPVTAMVTATALYLK